MRLIFACVLFFSSHSLSAQCWARFSAEAEKLAAAGQAEAAVKKWEAARHCPDKPADANVDEQIARVRINAKFAADDYAWAQALEAGSPEAVQAYLNKGFTRHLNEAHQKLLELNEGQLWKEVQAARSIKACDRYLNQYPNGKYRPAVRALRTELYEAETWQAATTANLPSLYEGYLREFPMGKHAAEAKSRLEALKKSARPD